MEPVTLEDMKRAAARQAAERMEEHSRDVGIFNVYGTLRLERVRSGRVSKSSSSARHLATHPNIPHEFKSMGIGRILGSGHEESLVSSSSQFESSVDPNTLPIPQQTIQRHVDKAITEFFQKAQRSNTRDISVPSMTINPSLRNTQGYIPPVPLSHYTHKNNTTKSNNVPGQAPAPAQTPELSKKGAVQAPLASPFPELKQQFDENVSITMFNDDTPPQTPIGRVIPEDIPMPAKPETKTKRKSRAKKDAEALRGYVYDVNYVDRHRRRLATEKKAAREEAQDE